MDVRRGFIYRDAADFGSGLDDGGGDPGPEGGVELVHHGGWGYLGGGVDGGWVLGHGDVREGEEFLARQEADRKMGFWTVGMVLWGVFGVAVLICVWRWEEGRGVDVHSPGSPKQHHNDVEPNP